MLLWLSMQISRLCCQSQVLNLRNPMESAKLPAPTQEARTSRLALRYWRFASSSVASKRRPSCSNGLSLNAPRMRFTSFARSTSRTSAKKPCAGALPAVEAQCGCNMSSSTPLRQSTGTVRRDKMAVLWGATRLGAEHQVATRKAGFF